VLANPILLHAVEFFEVYAYIVILFISYYKEMATDISELKPVIIRFPTEEEELKGFGVLLDSGMPVHATADDVYTINELQCSLLRQKGIKYIREK
jgi:capsule polysaccharide export protein KpsE/RkpR